MLFNKLLMFIVLASLGTPVLYAEDGSDPSLTDSKYSFSILLGESSNLTDKGNNGGLEISRIQPDVIHTLYFHGMDAETTDSVCTSGNSCVGRSNKAVSMTGVGYAFGPAYSTNFGTAYVQGGLALGNFKRDKSYYNNSTDLLFNEPNSESAESYFTPEAMIRTGLNVDLAAFTIGLEASVKGNLHYSYGNIAVKVGWGKLWH